ncbi:hypothetical protein [Haloarcula sp. Atlit-7R]|uniref:hypothetical protein n=1 Tax=Haloarcula sp. Atlit-7R TaxID=2282125 RepID=UPI00131434F2|nr:hypothetical protein [Haloarcula sp. Atlit-7R]
MADTYTEIADSVSCGLASTDGEIAFLTSDRERDSGFDSTRCTHPKVQSRGR